MRAWASFVAVGVGSLLLASSTSYAATIYACQKKIGGTIRIVGAKTRCLATEKKISWGDAAEITALRGQNATQQSEIAALQTQNTSQQTEVAALQSQNTSQQTEIAALQTQNTTLATQNATQQTEIAALQSLLQHFHRDGNNVSINGANLWITDGSGTTDGDVNGLGNLIIGYNASRVPFGGTDVRTGSHNLIVGDMQNYESYGGLVAGFRNMISGKYSSVSGGYNNTASDLGSSVSGGAYSTASGLASSVSGGAYSTASGEYSSVSGGAYSTASREYSSVSGGTGITESDEFGWSGGNYHTP